MLKFVKGNILESKAEALVNTVNTVGVMGKGIALAFKNSFPQVFQEYKNAVDNKEISIGNVQVVKTNMISPKYVINFPTKKHWRHPSKIQYIGDGIVDLIKKIKKYNINSIAIPPLGCGNGKLEWTVVKPLLQNLLTEVSENVDIIIFEPGFNDQKTTSKKNIKLTAARAILVYVLEQYRVLGYSINLLVAHKIAYFLQRLGEPLNLNFEKGYYGPYAHNLFHLLTYLNGNYIKFNADENKPTTQIQIIQKHYKEVEEYYLNSISEKQKERTKLLLDLIDGFESPFGLELLATVDYVIEQINTSNLDEIENKISDWTSRKRSLMKPYYIQVATDRLSNSGLLKNEIALT